MPSLYHLTAEFKAESAKLTDLYASPEAVEEALADMRFPVEVKASNVAAYLLNLEAEAEMRKNVLKRMKDEADRIQKRADHMRAYLLANMQASGITEISSTDGSFKILLRDNPESVLVDDESLIPDSMMREKISYEPDKAAIKSAMQEGEIVPGCRLVRTQRVEIK